MRVVPAWALHTLLAGMCVLVILLASAMLVFYFSYLAVLNNRNTQIRKIQCTLQTLPHLPPDYVKHIKSLGYSCKGFPLPPHKR